MPEAPTAEADRLAPLTAAERRIVGYLASGITTREAADILGVSLAAVRKLIAAAKRKSGARTLPQLAAMYVHSTAMLDSVAGSTVAPGRYYPVDADQALDRILPEARLRALHDRLDLSGALRRSPHRAHFTRLAARAFVDRRDVARTGGLQALRSQLAADVTRAPDYPALTRQDRTSHPRSETELELALAFAGTVIAGYLSDLARADDLTRLTPRQRAIAELLVEGSRYRDIAARLTISERQVRRHVIDAVERLDARNTEELAAVVSEAMRPKPTHRLPPSERPMPPVRRSAGDPTPTVQYEVQPATPSIPLGMGLTPQLARDWASIRSELHAAVPNSVFEIWLAPLTARRFINGTLFVTAPPEIHDWVVGRFGSVLQTCAAAVLGSDINVMVLRPDDPPPETSPQQAPLADHEQDFHPRLTFEQFVIGQSNRLAHAAALAVAELPGQAYNPLFLYGGPGLGKTHLLHAIGNYIRRHRMGLRVRSTTAERFTNEFVAALQTRNVDDFKARFRDTDVLLIDDIHFLQRKAKTEEEFFHTFNALQQTGSQLVLTSDRLPADMAALEARLLERFASGLVAELKGPDLATRLTILRKRVHNDGIELADERALHAIAHRITTNARALEGALIRVVAYHSLTRRPIDVELADEVLAGMYPHANPDRTPLTIARVQELTCEAFALSRDELLSSGRSGRVAWPRQVAMYLAREHTGATLPAIGREFGERDHTTVMYACRKAGERIASDPAAKAAIKALEHRLAEDQTYP